MRTDIYLHSLHAEIGCCNNEKNRELFEKILKSGALLSPKLSGEVCRYNFCGEDYISLCDYQKRHLGKGFRNQYNGYNQYVLYDPSIMFPKSEIEVIEPIILDKIIVFYSNYREYMKELGLSSKHRYTDLMDEVQVKDRISLDSMCGLTIPSNMFVSIFKSVEQNSRELFDEVLRYRELLDRYGYDIPIYDIQTTNLLSSYDDAYDTMLTLKKKRK